MSLLTIVQDACDRIGITRPSTVVGSTDAQVIQLLALLNKEGKELATGMSVGVSYDWQALQAEATFTTLATESQGAITTIASGFKYIIGGTIWNRSTRLPVYGSVNPQEWQNYKAWSVTSPFPKYRIVGGLLRLLPVPPADETYYFEYQSKNWCTDANGSNPKSKWAADTNVALLDEDLMTDGLVWRWKQAKGLDYAEDFATYQRDVLNAMARDVEHPTIDMLNGRKDQVGIVLPIGDWNV